MESAIDSKSLPGHKAASQSLQHYGKLGVLPFELREPIYINLLSTGHPALMQCSKLLYADMAPLLTKHGICRLNIISDRDEDIIRPHKRIPDNKIQHFDVIVNKKPRVDGRPANRPTYPYTPHLFLSRLIIPLLPIARVGKTFHISLSYDIFYEEISAARKNFVSLRYLTGFETFTVRGHLSGPSRLMEWKTPHTRESWVALCETKRGSRDISVTRC